MQKEKWEVRTPGFCMKSGVRKGVIGGAGVRGRRPKRRWGTELGLGWTFQASSSLPCKAGIPPHHKWLAKWLSSIHVHASTDRVLTPS